MIPILYDRDDIYAVRLGKGKLTETTRCVVHEELNGEYNLELDYPITGRLYDELKGRSTVLGYNPRKFSSGLGTTKCQGEYFDIEKATKPIDGIVTFFANHISRRFAEHVCLAGAFHGVSEPDYPSDYGNIAIGGSGGGTFPTFHISAPKSKLACLIGDAESFVSTSGGEVLFGSRRITIDGISRPEIYVATTNRIGKDRGASIRFGVNMLNVEQEKDMTGAYNAVVPFWDDGNGNITYVSGYVVQPTTPITPIIAVPLDLSNDFETQPTDAQMVEVARQHLDDKTPWTGSETIKVDFINGAEIDPHAPDILLGDTIHVYWGDADIATDLRVVAYDYDVLAERYISLELGTPQKQYVAITGESYAGASGGGGGVPCNSDYKIYDSVTDLGLSSGSATMAGIIAAMPDNSMLITSGDELASNEKPSGWYGQLKVIKPNPWRWDAILHGTYLSMGDWTMYMNADGTPTGVWIPQDYSFVKEGVTVFRKGRLRIIRLDSPSAWCATLYAEDTPSNAATVLSKVYNGSDYVDCNISIGTDSTVKVLSLWGSEIVGAQYGFLLNRYVTYFV